MSGGHKPPTHIKHTETLTVATLTSSGHHLIYRRPLQEVKVRPDPDVTLSSPESDLRRAGVGGGGGGGSNGPGQRGERGRGGSRLDEGGGDESFF